MLKWLFSWGGLVQGEGGFVQAVPYILQGMSALGGIYGKKKKYIDPEMLRQKYGPRAVASDTQELSNYILNSPYGQQLMASAAEQGQGIQNEMASRAAASGLSPDTGASSGASDFAVSAGSQAQTGLERGVKSSIYQSAMPIAAQQNADYAKLLMANNDERNAEPSIWQKLGAAAGTASSMFPGKKTTGAKALKPAGYKYVDENQPWLGGH